MSEVTERDVRAFVAEQLVEPLRLYELDAGALPATFDLLAEGVIDSFGFLELVLALEARYGVELDLEQLDADDLTRVGPLSAFVASQVRP